MSWVVLISILIGYNLWVYPIHRKIKFGHGGFGPTLIDVLSTCQKQSWITFCKSTIV